MSTQQQMEESDVEDVADDDQIVMSIFLDRGKLCVAIFDVTTSSLRNMHMSITDANELHDVREDGQG
ncbi:TPA: hypothetical protein N0F65_004301 [Lagenidium giganteum]|uniref:Uncharacterized protein n=1 Tax=Lagenidium giganteum TaxID=4803 RepID=A0AAV2ZB37_9STRA|nr:TPA: hypothetical protein N0F65_004301 [Lagenidium giganteum]